MREDFGWDFFIGSDGDCAFTLDGDIQVVEGPALVASDPASIEDSLQNLVALFHQSEDGQALQYELSLPQTNAWGIGCCYFVGMDSSQDSKQMYRVSLKFVEFRPEIDQVLQQQREPQKEARYPAPKQRGPKRN